MDSAGKPDVFGIAKAQYTKQAEEKRRKQIQITETGLCGMKIGKEERTEDQAYLTETPSSAGFPQMKDLDSIYLADDWIITAKIKSRGSRTEDL